MAASVMSCAGGTGVLFTEMQSTMTMKATLERWYLTGFQSLQVTHLLLPVISQARPLHAQSDPHDTP